MYDQRDTNGDRIRGAAAAIFCSPPGRTSLAICSQVIGGCAAGPALRGRPATRERLLHAGYGSGRYAHPGVFMRQYCSR